MDRQTTDHQAQKYRWYQKVLDFPGAVLFLIFMGMCAGYLKLTADPKKEIPGKRISITVRLYPFVLSVLCIIVGAVFDNMRVIHVNSFFASACIVLLAIRTLRFALNPLVFLDPLVRALVNSEVAILPVSAAEQMLKSMQALFVDANNRLARKYRSSKLSRDPFTTVFEKLAVNPRLPLGLFLVYYACTLTLSIFLFSALIKSSVASFGFSLHDYLLASVLRFTSGSTLAEVFGPIRISANVLAFESAISFCYLVIAILAVNTSANRSAEEFKDKLKPLLARGLVFMGSPAAPLRGSIQSSPPLPEQSPEDQK